MFFVRSYEKRSGCETFDKDNCTTKTTKTKSNHYDKCGDYLLVELIRNKKATVLPDGNYIVSKGNTYIDGLLEDVCFNSTTYRLEMLVRHDGVSSNKGHYYTHRLLNNEWILFDDDQVVDVSLDKMKAKMKTLKDNISTCLLVYSKMKKGNLF